MANVFFANVNALVVFESWFENVLGYVLCVIFIAVNLTLFFRNDGYNGSEESRRSPGDNEASSIETEGHALLWQVNI